MKPKRDRHIQVRLSPELWDRLAVFAKRESRTKAAIMRLALRRYLGLKPTEEIE